MSSVLRACSAFCVLRKQLPKCTGRRAVRHKPIKIRTCSPVRASLCGPHPGLPHTVTEDDGDGHSAHRCGCLRLRRLRPRRKGGTRIRRRGWDSHWRTRRPRGRCGLLRSGRSVPATKSWKWNEGSLQNGPTGYGGTARSWRVDTWRICSVRGRGIVPCERRRRRSKSKTGLPRQDCCGKRRRTTEESRMIDWPRCKSPRCSRMRSRWRPPGSTRSWRRGASVSPRRFLRP